MKEHDSYIGFPPLPEKEAIIGALLHDPPDVRWRVVRDLFRIADPKDREDLTQTLEHLCDEGQDPRIGYRLILALEALHQPLPADEYVVVRGQGAFRAAELESLPNGSNNSHHPPPGQEAAPVIDTHIHPKTPDLRLLAHLKEAGITRAVILATDTDPEDINRPEIRKQIRKDYSRSSRAQTVPVATILEQIKASLHSPTHVTNRDIADWVEDYPDIFVGFGSVNLGKSGTYVEEKLAEISRLGLKGIKLLPYSQFFNPAKNKNMEQLLEHCRRNGLIILCHSGCGPGPFEILELNRNSHPGLWKALVKRYPDVPLVLAHFGSYSTLKPGIWLREVLELAGRYRNVYADVAAVPWLLEHEGLVKEIRRTMGLDRVLFGTDYPVPLHAGIAPDRLVQGLKENGHLTEEEKGWILGKNAARLLGIQH